jgi:hypothetical protein
MLSRRTDAHLHELFPNVARIEHTTRMFAFRYKSAEHWVEVFRDFYGPTYTAFLASTQMARPPSRPT